MVDVNARHDLAQHCEVVMRELVRLGAQAQVEVVDGRFHEEVVEGGHLEGGVV
jgi:hypothetical protein